MVYDADTERMVFMVNTVLQDDGLPPMRVMFTVTMVLMPGDDMSYTCRVFHPMRNSHFNAALN